MHHTDCELSSVWYAYVKHVLGGFKRSMLVNIGIVVWLKFSGVINGHETCLPFIDGW